MPRDNIISLAQHRASRAYMRAVSEGPARVPGALADRAANSLPHIPDEQLARIFGDPEAAGLVDDRPDLAEQLRAVTVTWPAKLLVAAVWVVCSLYCIAIWTGWAR